MHEAQAIIIVPDDKTLADIVKPAKTLSSYKNESIVESKNIHMTLRHLGMVSNELIKVIKHDVSRINLETFTITIDKAEIWKKPGITVQTPNARPATLLKLVDEIERIYIRSSLESEKKPFRPHLTVIKKSQHFLNKVMLKPVTWPVKNFFLLESKTVKGKIVYTEKGRWNLVKCKYS